MAYLDRPNPAPTDRRWGSPLLIVLVVLGVIAAAAALLAGGSIL